MSVPAGEFSPRKDGLSIIRSLLFDSHPGIRFGMSSKPGGVSPDPLGLNLSFRVGDAEENVIRNRQMFFGELNIPLDSLAIPSQIHGDAVRTVSAPGNYEACDSLATCTPGVYLCVTVADCVPVFLYDPVAGIVAAIHVGWQGATKGILRNTLALLTEQFGSDPRNLRVYLGPCAGPCCYEVGEEVASRFAGRFVSRTDLGTFLDLKSANVWQLNEAGVLPSFIEVSTLCTIEATRLLHSFRRDRERSGRMMGVIGLLK